MWYKSEAIGEDDFLVYKFCCNSSICSTKSPFSGPWFVRAHAGIRQCVSEAIGKDDLSDGARLQILLQLLHLHQTALFRSVICTESRRNAAACGTNQRQSEKTICASPNPASAPPSEAPNRPFQVRDLYWHTPKSGGACYQSKAIGKDDLSDGARLQILLQFFHLRINELHSAEKNE